MKIFWCERTGERLFYKSVHCACGHKMADQSNAAEYDGDDWAPEPFACHACGASVTYDVRGSKQQWRRFDTGELTYDLPAGAVYEHQGYSWGRQQPSNWRQSKRPDGKQYIVSRPGEDGRVLAVVCPDGHHWIIDSRASNCTMPDDDEHWCWVRHGKPEDGTLHVDKNGRTCAAGAGSILTHTGWHGFLHAGDLYPC